MASEEPPESDVIPPAMTEPPAPEEPATASGIHGGLAANAEPESFGRKPLMVVVRKKRMAHAGGGHSGGSWKIAYADFVTAMMAFFLLMWLLTSTNHGDLQGIADYFNRPLNSLATQGPGSQATTPPKTEVNVEDKRRKGDQDSLVNLKAKLDTLIQQNEKLRAFKNQIKIDVTNEGLRIQIIDDKNRPMFDKGDATLKSYTRDILDRIGKTLNDVPNHITITGHTDSLAYSGNQEGYSNWELSSDRANAARRELLTGGMNDDKILQVRGLADALPLFKAQPNNPGNRRISIVVLNKQTEDNFLQDGGTSNHIDVGPAAPLSVSPDGASPQP